MTRVLIADDDEDVRRALKKTLATAGYEVDEAADGARLLELHREKQADVLLIDVYMPEMDGIEAMVRLLVEFPTARIIAISGGGYRDKAEVLQTAARLGAVRCVTKPFTTDDVLSAVRESLAGHQ